MIPIRDTERTRIRPVVTWLLIIINVAFFLLETLLPAQYANGLIYTFALIPAKVNLLNPFTWLPFLTHMFLHGSWFHLISNMWILMIFGDNIEERMGPGRYLLFYVLGGISAGLLQYLLSPTISIPTLGASGAIAAVMGAYFMMFPRSRVVTFIPIFFFGGLFRVPSMVYLGFWFISQLFSGLSAFSMRGMQAGGVAWWAHIGGFLFGLIFARRFKEKPVRIEVLDENGRWQ